MVGELENSVTVTRKWEGETVVLVGGGPSLTQADADYCRGLAKLIAINDAYRLAPWANILYAYDVAWWDYHMPYLGGFVGEKWTCNELAAKKHPLNFIKSIRDPGLSECNGYIHTGGNSGFQALNLAVLFGAKRLILLGFDMQRQKGRSHWFGEHPGNLNKHSNYLDFISHFVEAAPQLRKLGVEVINCSRDTGMTCFPRGIVSNGVL